jgi:cytoskeleton protein RodZ
MSASTLQDGQTGHDAGGGVTLGRRLRRVREAQGLNIEAVAGQLHLDVTRLEALERDDLSSFPAPVFARGYVRGYARLLALPEAELIALYEKQAPPSAPSLHPLQTTRYDKKTVLRTRAAWAIALLALLAVAGFWLMQYTPWRDEPPVTSTVAVTPAREEATPPAPPVAATEYAPQPLDVSTSTPPQQAAAEPPAVEAAQSIPPEEASVDALVLRFNAESWLEIVDQRGKTLAYELVPAGETRRFERPRLPLQVRLGNSSAVNIEYNGKVFDQTPYARKNVAYFVFDKKTAAALQARESDIVSVTAE